MAAKTDEFSKAGFAKSYLLPVLLIGVGPLFSLWFFGYAEDSLDARVRESVLRGIRNDRSLKEDDRKQLTEAYSKFRASKLMANDEPNFDGMAFSAYYGRHLTAREYQKLKAAKEKPE